MNISTKQKQRHETESPNMGTGESGAGMSWALGLTDIQDRYCVQNRQRMRTYCTPQGTPLRALWRPKWEGNPKKAEIRVEKMALQRAQAVVTGRRPSRGSAMSPARPRLGRPPLRNGALRAESGTESAGLLPEGAGRCRERGGLGAGAGAALNDHASARFCADRKPAHGPALCTQQT